MSEPATLGFWILLTISAAGHVSTSSLPTKGACEDAASVAETGMTVAEISEQSRHIESELAKQETAWAKTHPPREPITDCERTIVDKTKAFKKYLVTLYDGICQKHSNMTLGGNDEYIFVTDDNKVREVFPLSVARYIAGHAGSSNIASFSELNRITKTKCFYAETAVPSMNTVGGK